MTQLTVPSPLLLNLPDDDATARLGGVLGEALSIGDAILLSGGLGAGKTALARAAIQRRLASSGRTEDIPSPTFTLVQTYDADIPIWHADLYRLSGEEEVYELGLDEAFETAAVLIEWPDRLGGLTPDRALRISLDFDPDGDGRIATVEAIGLGWDDLLKELRGAA